VTFAIIRKGELESNIGDVRCDFRSRVSFHICYDGFRLFQEGGELRAGLRARGWTHLVLRMIDKGKAGT
jgi:hypothetical protein